MKWFDLAEAWNAVLLVDEADIFLEQRKNRDLSRNGLVTAFLRRMEYFRGLLFLTTNRVGQIDDAFVSRVHMAIGYERLSPEFRRNIWEGFFRKLERERAGKVLVGPSAKKFVLTSKWVEEIELNGRESGMCCRLPLLSLNLKASKQLVLQAKVERQPHLHSL